MFLHPSTEIALFSQQNKIIVTIKLQNYREKRIVFVQKKICRVFFWYLYRIGYTVYLFLSLLTH